MDLHVTVMLHTVTTVNISIVNLKYVVRRIKPNTVRPLIGTK